ncbi:3-hydroxyacyl-CoA dehydrogenase/enoyl-CoA hydratase family protein [Salinigranum salinum]|uniref:3-hydroxyacyl-CoA dehydrogenase/enoyl-CoA hydratase family protein n=1 Tax=Salinigranum salinum TaxID=1364937 RepID=UPI001261270B|nr:3-hydroxyacyl-CoA dehydrogenase/enoyl-CoA hydratase family protein [Salinigranum salinum]
MGIDDVSVIAVLGAGNMGHGIAEVAALAGFDVTLRDIEEELVQQGYDEIEWSLGKLVEKERLSREEADAALARITPLVDLDSAVRDADVVVEVVPERMDVKKDVYAAVEEFAPERAVFVTNTSSLSITELGRETDRPERFCGMHFFNPPVRMQLVEVISGADTADATLELVEALAERLGKTPVRVHEDSPGFVVNRVLVPLLNEAAWIVDSGDASLAAVDSTSKYGLGLPMGCFELADQVGIDVALHVLEYMHDELGDAYEPCPLLESKVDAGDLGKKSGTGFYDYDDGGAQVPNDQVRDAIRERLLAVMANEVAGLVANGVADAEAIDRAMQLGAGFPEGPAKLADDAGLDRLVDRLDALHEETGAARYAAVDYLRDLADADEGFHAGDAGDADDYDTISVERRDGVGTLAVDRPHRMNSINADVLAELDDAITRLEDDDETRTILLTGTGDRAFSAGADVQRMAAELDTLSAVELSRRGQETFGRLEASPLPVVAAIDGFCLGGGMELATCADLRIASRRSSFGQPEHNLGLVPGWGGTQRLRHVVGEGRAKEIILTAERFDAETMADYGFVNEVVANDALDDRAFELARDLARGPPVAQAFTKRAMRRGRDDTEAGLEVEAQAFGHVFGTDDVMEGIAAFDSDREPEFTGE